MQGLGRKTVSFAAVCVALAASGVNWPGAYAQGPGRVLEPVRTPPRIVGDLPWRVLDPVSHENLLVFPVVARGGHDTSNFVTLDDALASGDVVIAESGSALVSGSRGGGNAQVNQLMLVNRGKRPVLLLAGEVVSGGKQDRIISKDRIIAPGSEPLPLDVFCVERGRWSGAKAEFSESKVMAHLSVREKAAVDKAQDRVWGAVRSGTTAAAPPAAEQTRDAALGRSRLDAVVENEVRSESYEKIYRSKRVATSVDAFSAEMARRFAQATAGLRGEQVIGVVVAYGNDVAWSDLFASNALFERYWQKLLRSYVVEALARPHVHSRATVAEARDFLAPMAGRETIESEPGVYRWREIAAGHFAQIELDSLLGRTFTLHRVKIHRTT